MTPEGRVKDKIKRILKERSYWFMPVQTGIGSHTVDFLVCVNGYFLGIEAKADTQLTTRQKLVLNQIHEHGGSTIVLKGMKQVDELKEVLDYLERLPTYAMPDNRSKFYDPSEHTVQTVPIPTSRSGS